MQRSVRVVQPSHVNAPRPMLPSSITKWLLIATGGALLLTVTSVMALSVGALVVYGSGRILPGVSVAGISLGGLTTADATAQLQAAWSQITVRDGQRTWSVPTQQLGLTLDAAATSLAAQQRGHGDSA